MKDNKKKLDEVPAKEPSRDVGAQNEPQQDESGTDQSGVPTAPHSQGATGPRTPEGKEQSKLNATKHGILSKELLLKGESSEEYQSLLDGLREDRLPVGMFEELSVEKLAAYTWRLRRLLRAERGQIEANALPAEPVFTTDSLIRSFSLQPLITDPESLDACHSFLRVISDLDRIRESDQPTVEELERGLRNVYGTPRPWGTGGALLDTFASWAMLKKIPEEQRQAEGPPSLAERREALARELKLEVDRLEQLRRARDGANLEKRRVETLRRSIPDPSHLDSLIRYETALERNFDRTLSQLLRAQRIRLGLPVPPDINVKFG